MPGPHRHSSTWDACVAAVKKNSPGYNPYAVCTARVRAAHRNLNPRKLSATEQRAQVRRMLEWSRAALKQKDTQLPGGRMLHAVARDEITAARTRLRAGNPRSKARPGFVIEARRRASRVYYAGGEKFIGSKSAAKRFGSQADCSAYLWLLRKSYPKALKGWVLEVVAA